MRIRDDMKELPTETAIEVKASKGTDFPRSASILYTLTAFPLQMAKQLIDTDTPFTSIPVSSIHVRERDARFTEISLLLVWRTDRSPQFP